MPAASDRSRPRDAADALGEQGDYPGQSIGLPAEGIGSLAPWRNRVAALIVDWAASMAFAVGAFGYGVIREHSWRAQMPMATFFVQAAVLTTLLGGSFGQLLARIGVTRLDGRPIAWWQAIARTALKCLVIPIIVVGAERRHLADLVLGTVVVSRK